jgi:hypothetical protein
MGWRIAAGVFVIASLASACSTSAQSSSSTTTSASHRRSEVEACVYVQSWAKDPMTFELFSALATTAESADNSNLHDEGRRLAASVPTHSAGTIGNVLDQMVHTCIKLGLFKAPTVTAPQGG